MLGAPKNLFQYFFRKRERRTGFQKRNQKWPFSELFHRADLTCCNFINLTHVIQVVRNECNRLIRKLHQHLKGNRSRLIFQDIVWSAEWTDEINVRQLVDDACCIPRILQAAFCRCDNLKFPQQHPRFHSKYDLCRYPSANCRAYHKSSSQKECFQSLCG